MGVVLGFGVGGDPAIYDFVAINIMVFGVFDAILGHG